MIGPGSMSGWLIGFCAALMRWMPRQAPRRNLPGFDYHPLSGKRSGVYTVHVNGPWCVTFAWDGTDAIRVDLEQYH